MRAIRSSVAWSRVILSVVLTTGGAAAASTVLTDLGGNHYRVVFAFKAPAGAKTVHLAGTFNGWNPQAHALDGPDDDQVFRTHLVLDKGRYEYKFVVDGRNWITDPDNPHQAPGYGNSILFVGSAAPDASGATIPPPQPVEMAGEAEHPAPIKRLIESLAGENEPHASGALEKWFAEHPMPLFTESSVTFVYADATAADVSVQIAGYGSRTGYEMRRLVEGAPVFAVSLKRAELPQRSAYTFKVLTNGRTETVIDPHAWSLTSRSGKPAALVVEVSDQRGRIEVLRDFRPSSGDLPPRDLYVYLPPGYDRNTERRRPVLYMHDGQNCWDDPVEPFGHGGWCVNLTADRLINADRVEPFIVVGVANTPDRMREYGLGPGGNSGGGAAHPYLRFLERDVVPLIDGRYRTLSDAQHRAVMGSSMGGTISLQAALLHPDTFGMAACLSPAFGFAGDSGRRYAELIKTIGKAPVRLYIDSGTGGAHQDGAPLTRKMVALLRKTGWQDGADLLHSEDPGADHNERAWRARLDEPLTFLFGR